MNAFNFPNSPTLGQTFAPADGPIYVWDGAAWRAIGSGAPSTVRVGDTPPLNPVPGQLWWESDSGKLFIWYSDPDSAQWVHIFSGPTGPIGPAGEGIYDTTTAMPTIPVPEGVNAIRTNGYAAPGDGGGALYKRVVSAPAHAGKVQSMDGAWWELAEPEVRAEMFGVRFDDDAGAGTDNAVALQAFLTYVGTVACRKAIMSGNVYSNAPLTLTGTGTGRTELFEFNTCIRFGAAVTTTGLTISGLAVSEQVEVRFIGQLYVKGPGSNSYASRTLERGIYITGCGRCRFDMIKVQFCKFIGLDINDTTNTSLLDIGSVMAYDCGPASYDATTKLEANWSAPVNSGSSGSLGQRTKLSVTAQPPNAYNLLTNCAVVINAQLYWVAAADSGAGTIDIFPWIDNTIGTSGTLFYLFGGGVCTFGNDINVIGISQLDALRCSVGMMDRAAYGARLERLVSQGCGVGLMIGQAISTAHVGGAAESCYFENNIWDIVRMTSATTNHRVASTYALTLSKCISMAEARFTSNSMNTVNGFRTMPCVLGPTAYVDQAKSGNNLLDAASAGTLKWGASNHIFQRNSWTITIPAPSPDENRLYGYDATMIGFTGTGANGQPTGAFTFNPPAGWTINGAASAVFSGFTGAVLFMVEAFMTTLDIKCRPIAGAAPEAPTIIATNADTTLTPGTTSRQVIHTGTLTTPDKTLTLSTTNAVAGTSFRITRTGTGAFNLVIGTATPKNLITNTWCEATYNGSAWVLTAYGAL